MDFNLTEEHQMVRKLVRDFAQKEIAPHIKELDRQQEFDAGLPARLLDMLGHFLVFEDDGSGVLSKKMAGYHQFHAANVALRETLRAAKTHATDYVADEYGHYETGARPVGLAKEMREASARSSACS